MAAITEIVNVNISLLTLAVTEAGFGTPMIVAYHTDFPERIRFYSRLTEVAVDFDSTHPAYKAAAAAFAQSPRVTQVAIGRRASAPDLEVRLTPVVANSTIYKVKVNGEDASYTSDSSATVAEIVAGLKSAIDALSITTVVTTNDTTHLTVKGSVAGDWFSINPYDISLIAVQQQQAATGLATDLAAILAENSNWYGIINTTASDAEIAALSTFALANEKMLFAGTQDSANATAALNVSGTDVMNELKVLGSEFTVTMYHEIPDEMAQAAFAGKCFGYAPGALNPANKQLVGVSTSNISSTQLSNIKAKFGNAYVSISGVGATREGKTASGQFLDFIRDRSWLKTRLESELASHLLRVPKIPFTDAGIASVESIIRGVLKEAVDAGFLEDGSITMTVPRASAVSSGNRAARKLATIEWTARAQGGINEVTINGFVTI